MERKRARRNFEKGGDDFGWAKILFNTVLVLDEGTELVSRRYYRVYVEYMVLYISDY